GTYAGMISTLVFINQLVNLIITCGIHLIIRTYSLLSEYGFGCIHIQCSVVQDNIFLAEVVAYGREMGINNIISCRSGTYNRAVTHRVVVLGDIPNVLCIKLDSMRNGKAWFSRCGSHRIFSLGLWYGGSFGRSLSYCTSFLRCARDD